MKNIGFVFVMLILFVGNLNAQRIAAFQKEDVRAMPITSAVKKQLTKEAWRCYDRVFVDREGFTSKQGMPHLFLNPKGVFRQGNKKGTWSIEGGNILKISPNKKINSSTQQELLAGGYAIYNISEYQMTLAKVLTTSSDMMIIYHFESEEGRLVRLEKEWEKESYKTQKERLRNEAAEKISDEVEVEKEEQYRLLNKEKATKKTAKKSNKKLDTSKMSVADRFMRGLKPSGAN